MCYAPRVFRQDDLLYAPALSDFTLSSWRELTRPMGDGGSRQRRDRSNGTYTSGFI